MSYELTVFLAFQVALLPIQALLFLAVYSERRRQQLIYRAAVQRLLHVRR